MKLRHEPVALILSRQNMATLDRTKYASAAGVAKGAYILTDAPDGKPDVILIGTGSEVGLCVEAHDKLQAEGIKSRVVSMPSWELFDHQPEEYRNTVLPPSVKARVSVEQASTMGWKRYADGNVGMTTFGASAPLKELQKKFGFTPDAVVAAAKESDREGEVSHAHRDRFRPCRVRAKRGPREVPARDGLRRGGCGDAQHGAR